VVLGLLLAGWALRSHLPGVEQVQRHQLPDHAEVVAVGREARVGRAIHDDVRDQGPRARREDVVVRAQDGLGGARRGDDHGGHGAEADQHEVGAVPGREACEGDVRRTNEVHVPDDGEPPGAAAK
jgi:hypothetical protein